MNISNKERMDILVKESSKTMTDLCDKLDKYGRCITVRPTGFGKTYLLVHLAYEYIKKFPDKKVMYIFPSEIIRTEIKNNPEYDWSFIKEHFIFVTYQALAKSVGETGTVKSREKYISDLKSCSICLLDEVHRSAANGYKLFYEITEDLYGTDKVRIAGVTATPKRHSEEQSEWIFNELFKGVSTYDYTLWNAIDSGLLIKPIYCMAKFQVMNLADDFKKEVKKAHLEANGYFNEEDFETSFNKAYKSNGSESEIIYKNLKKAGYNLLSDSPDDSYIKFIVFFNNAQDLVDNGEETERWFFDAIEKEASKDFGVNIEFEKHVDYVISVTADQNNNNIVKQHTDAKPYRSCIYNASDVGSNDEYKGHRIDLIFNVNVITMGYHVDHISGLMMRRGTGTDIMYYQQLGRCFSVKATRPSIVFDLAYNKNTQMNRDRKRIFSRAILSNEGSEPTTLIENVSEGSERERSFEEAFVVDFEDGIDDLFDKWKDPNFSYVSRVRYLYEDRNMPIALIAQDTGLSCVKVSQYLVEAGVKLKYETPMYEFLNHDNVLEDTRTNEFKLLKYLYSKKAYSVFIHAKKDAKRGVSSLFVFIVKLLGGK